MASKTDVKKIVVNDIVEAEDALIEMRGLGAEIAELDWGMLTLKGAQDRAKKDLGALESAIEKWAKKDRKTWPGKTLALSNGTIFFQTSPGKVSLIKSVAKTWDEAVGLLLRTRKHILVQFLRQKKPQLDKELITAEFQDGRITNEALATVGLQVEKPEVCFIQVNQ